MVKRFGFRDNLPLFVILVAAFFIRIIGIFPGHPSDHPDEPMSYGSALEMITHGDLNPRRFDYPAGVPLVHYVFFQVLPLPIMYFKVIFLHPKVLVAALTLGRQQFMDQYTNELFGVNGIIFLYWSRFLTAALGTASVYLAYLIGKKLFTKTAGLTAALFLAFNYRHVLSSHLALSDIPNGFFALLAFYSATLLLEKNTRKRYLLCGLCVGLSIAMKYQVFAVLPFLFVHLIWVFRRKSMRELMNPHFFLGLTVIPVVFALLNPYFFANLQKALEVTSIVSRRYGAGSFRFNFYPVFYLYRWGIGELPFLSIIAGVIVAVFLSPLRTLFLFSYVGPFLYVFLYYMGGGTYIRNFSTVIPFFALFAGYPFALLLGALGKKKHVIFIAGGIALLLIFNASSFLNSIALDTGYVTPWARDALTEWVLQHVPKKSRILNDNVSVPTSIKKPLEITPWGHEEGNAVTELMDNNYDFAVLNTAWNQIYFFWFNTAPKQLMSTQDIPYSDLWNSYRGYVLSEYLRYTVAEFYKPWQAPENSYLVLKIPTKPSTLGKMIKAFHFQQDKEGWTGEARWDGSDGHEEIGSLVLTKANRIVSPSIPVTPGKLYTIEGFAKADTEIRSNLRDGFFRVDFYNTNARAVSGRVFGPSHWAKERVVVQAPIGAITLTISFQRENSDIPYRIDDVAIYESDEAFIDRLPNVPYISPTIQNTTLFPNSIY